MPLSPARAIRHLSLLQKGQTLGKSPSFLHNTAQQHPTMNTTLWPKPLILLV
jgi:hypothetical protein